MRLLEKINVHAMQFMFKRGTTAELQKLRDEYTEELEHDEDLDETERTYRTYALMAIGAVLTKRSEASQ